MSESTNVKFGFYNALYITSDSKYDRLYESGQMSKLFDGLIIDGIYLSSREDDPSNKQFMVTAGSGMNVNIAPGKAWFNGTYTISNAIETRGIAPSDSTNTRIDAVVIEINMKLSVRENDIKVITGTPANPAVKPSLDPGEDGVYWYPIAYVTVPKNSTKVESYNIDYVVGIETPYFAWLCERLDISEIYSKWEPILGSITMPFLSWFDSMQDMLGNGDSDYTNIKAEVNEINNHDYIKGIFPKVDETLKEFDGDGSTVEFDITPDNGSIGSIADIFVDGEMVHEYTFNPETNKVTLKTAPDSGTDNVKIYYVLNKDYNSYTVYFS